MDAADAGRYRAVSEIRSMGETGLALNHYAAGFQWQNLGRWRVGTEALEWDSQPVTHTVLRPLSVIAIDRLMFVC